MREILFRAKNKVTLEWEYGSLLQSEIDTNGKCRCAIAERFADDFCVNMVPVIPETVGQFTGLLDKQGKKVFEGDIIHVKEYYERRNGTVVADLERTGFKIEWHTKTDFNEYLHVRIDAIEVTGTIHD